MSFRPNDVAKIGFIPGQSSYYPYTWTKKKVFADLKEWPKVSSNFLFLWEAVEKMGQTRFGEDWTGREILDTVVWPSSPNDDVTKAVNTAQYKIVPTANGQFRALSQPYDQHVLDRQAHLARLYAAKPQIGWEKNQAALLRLRAVCTELHQWFRDGEVQTYARATGHGHEPHTMLPSEWYLEGAFERRFCAAEHLRAFGQPPQNLPVYVFVDRAQLEAKLGVASVDAEPVALPMIGSLELDQLSPYLRLAIKVAVDQAVSATNHGKVISLTKELLDKAPAFGLTVGSGQGEDLSPTFAESIAKAIRWPSARAGKGANLKT